MWGMKANGSALPTGLPAFGMAGRYEFSLTTSAKQRAS